MSITSDSAPVIFISTALYMLLDRRLAKNPIGKIIPPTA
jgi:hypothetical protein